MKKDRLPVGVALMLSSALLTCLGQLCWKLSANEGSALYLLADRKSTRLNSSH